MLIFRESGRLGNQIFQYAAIKNIANENEKIILLGFEDFQKNFVGINANIINSHSPRYARGLYYRLYYALDVLSKQGIISRIYESKDIANPQIYSILGYFKRLKFIEESYFQGERYFDPAIFNSLKIKQKYLIEAKDLLTNIIGESNPFFVHIRRGDYMSWPNMDYPAILPAIYYQKCIDIINSKFSNLFWIFTSDDPQYVEDVFGTLKNSYISKGSSIEDFALMTQCSGGILSASSFSYWAAYFSSLQNKNSYFLAPKYWAGHRQKRWHPSSIASTFLEYIDY